MSILKCRESKCKMRLIMLIVLMLPAIYALVYYTGGIKYVYSHTMYIPIVFAGVALGKKYGLAFGIIGGILLGPLMPLTFDPYESQEFFNWFYRLLVFTTIGGLSGAFSDTLNRYILKSRKMVLYNTATNNPNQYYLYTHLNKATNYTLISLLLSDKDKISQSFGTEVFNKLMRESFLELKKSILIETIIVQSDTDKFWLAIPAKTETEVIEQIKLAIEKIQAYSFLRIYIEIYIGLKRNVSYKEIINSKVFQKVNEYALYAKKFNISYPLTESNFNKKEEPKIELLSEFKNALNNDETFLAYQPIVNLSNLKNHGYEALIRWDHPEIGVIQPLNFIPLVEKTQLVHPLLEWVLTKSTKMLNHVNTIDNQSVVSVNFSANNFVNDDLVEQIVEISKNNNIKPENLIIEITESVLIENEAICEEKLKELRKMGFSVAIDDYGSEYSSLNYISKFSIDYLKLDRYFISNLDNKSSYEIVKSTISLAHKLGFKVVAEGVEKEKDVILLKEFGCDYAQGYYFSKPIPNVRFIEYIKNDCSYSLNSPE